MTEQERMQLLDKACDVLSTADQIISYREDAQDGTRECLVLDLPFVYGLYFGALGAKKLIEGESLGNTELNFINIVAANYAFALDALGVVSFEPYEQVKTRLGAKYDSFFERAEQQGDDAS